MRKPYIWWALLALLAIVLDQITKWAVVDIIAYRDVVPVLPFFNLVHVYNYGAAFSFLADQPGWQRWFFTGLALVISVVLVVWMRRLKPEEMHLGWGLALVLGGAWGNVIDRMRLGYVIDFLDFYYADWHYAAFNIADSAIFLGVVWLLIFAFKSPKS